MAPYLKLVESMDLPLLRHPLVEDPDVVSEVLLGKRSDAESLDAGDLLVLYAVGGSKAIFAIVRLLEAPEIDRYAHDSNAARRRWPHAARCLADPHEVVEDLELAPKLAEASPRLAAVSLHDRSLLALDDDEFELARDLIRRHARSARIKASVNKGPGTP